MLRSITLAAVLTFLTACIPAATPAQKHILLRGSVEVEASAFHVDLEPNPADYAGLYGFGDSEWESTLHISVEGNRVTGKLTYAEWANNTFEPRELRLEGGRIDGAMLIAPGWSGVFVRWEGNDYEQGGRGLIIFRAPRRRLDTEFGYREGKAR